MTETEKYTGVRCRYPWLRINAFIHMDTQDAQTSIARSRLELMEQFEKQGQRTSEIGADVASLEPWKVEVIPASWGYPPRVMVTW